MVFHGFKLVFMGFHGFRSVFMVFHGSRLVFHSSRSVFMVFMVSGWFFMVFMVPGWFFIVPGWFFSKMYPPKLYPGPTIQSRSAARRAAQDLVCLKKNVNENFHISWNTTLNAAAAWNWVLTIEQH